MTPSISFIEWFRQEPIPVLASPVAIIAGGTSTLGGFIDAVSRLGPGRLTFETAFGSAAIEEPLPGLRDLNHRFLHLSIVSSSAGECSKLLEGLGRFPWASLQIGWKPGVHSKVYVFTGEKGASACLVGSHNLTVGGAASNEEVGVMFYTHVESLISTIARAFETHALKLLRRATIHHDNIRTAISAPRDNP